MKVIGFRCAPKCVRYAVVDIDAGALEGTLLNASDESRLVYPKGMEALEDRLRWLSHEVDRILHKHQDVDKVVVKVNEFTNDTKAKRASSYADAVIILGCAGKNVPIAAKIYSSLSTTSAKALAHAEHRVGRTAKYWDKQVADAVVAAWSGRK